MIKKKHQGILSGLMSIPGNPEPGVFSRQQQVQHQQTIPIKKRRFPIIQTSSPQEEKSNIDDGVLSSGEAINKADAAPTSVTAVKKEVVGLANVDVHESKSAEAKPRISLGPSKVGLHNEKSSEPKNLDSSLIAQSRTLDVKREIISEGACRLKLSGGKMNVELSLGPKEPLVPALKTQDEAILHSSEKSDSLLTLALHEEKVVMCDKTMDTVSNPVCANRSNWDLNTTMDAWEGSTTSDAVAHGLVNIGGFSKTSSYHDDRSSLTIAGTAFLGSDKGKQVLDGQTSSSLKSCTQLCKTDISLGLRLAMSNMDTNWEPSSLSGNVGFTSVSPTLSSNQVQLPIVNASRTVKSEPVDDNSKLDCSIGSSSSNNLESLKLTSVKRECANSHAIVAKLLSPEKLDDRRLIKSEVVQEHKQEGLKSKDADVLSFARVMQHQESCASSSPLSVSLLSRGPSPAWLPTCSELTTVEELSNLSEQSFHSKESQRNDELAAIPKLGISSVVDQNKCKLARIDEHTGKLCQNDDVEEKKNISSEMHEEDTSGSDSVDDVMSEKEDEYEDGEVREHVRQSAEGDPIVEGNDADKLKLVKSDSQNLQPSVPSADQIISESDAVKKNLDENHCDPIKDCVTVCNEPNNENKSLQKPCEVSEVVADETRAISVIADREIDPSGEDVEESPRKEAYRDIPTDGIPTDGSLANVVTECCSVENDLTLSKVEASPNGDDSAKDSNNASNKSRIINLSRPSVMAATFRTKSISNRLMTSRSGKERYSDFSGEVQPRGNRDEFYTGGSNKFVKDRVHDQSVRNSRPTFMRGKGRASGYFGSGRGRGRGDWDSRHDFASESSYGQSDYRVIRRKHASSTDVDLENNGYNIPQDGNRNKTINDEFPSQRRGSFRRLSAGDRDGPVSRGFQMLHRATSDDCFWFLEVNTAFVREQSVRLGTEVVAWSKGVVGEAKIPVVISGPSGVGKGTLIAKLMEDFPSMFGFSVSHTTRAPRTNEQNSVHYHFTEHNVMEKDIKEGKFLEFASVHGNLYGTSVEAVEAVTDQGKRCILDIDVQGVRSVRATSLEAIFIFICPPSFEELEKRLRARGTETEEQIQKRLRNARAEIDQGSLPGLFDHILVNDDLQKCYENLKKLLGLSDCAKTTTNSSAPEPIHVPMEHTISKIDKKILINCTTTEQEKSSSNMFLLDLSSIKGGAPGRTRSLSLYAAKPSVNGC